MQTAPSSAPAAARKEAERKTKPQLLHEVEELRARVAQLEAERVAGAAARSPEHTLLHSVLQSISFPLYIIDVATHKILLANTATYAGELPAGTTCYSLTHHRQSPCTGAEGPCPIDEVKRTRARIVVEHVHYDQQGHAKHVEIHAFPIFDDAGNVVQMIEYNVDITERKRVAAELLHHQQSLDMLVNELRRSNEELRDFMSVAAHDIRSPIVAVSSAAGLLKELLDAKLDDKDRRLFAILIRGVNRTAAMITSLYRCCQVNSAGIVRSEVDLNKVVQELQEFHLLADLEKSGGRIHVADQLHVVFAEEMQVLELMQNLLANALRYHRKGVQPEIRIRSREVGNERIRIEIEDNGLGIRDADREKVFGLFTRLDDAREHEGLGLGLTFCKRVAERHGGRIGVQSTYGSGSTFWVELPKASSPQAQPSCHAC
jgi:signal transduction histidine kinase